MAIGTMQLISTEYILIEDLVKQIGKRHATAV
jgi:hypothetical protein